MTMNRQSKFLTAEWSNVLMLNYAVDSTLLQQFVPRGTELDTFDGKTYLSLVGFEFNRTRMFGLSVPFHQSFEEVNLRFYVKRAAKRGVAFIRELVPRSAIATIARIAFNENYSCVPMSHRIETRTNEEIAEAEYAWGSEAERCSIRIETQGTNFLPDENSLSHFITEHYWGYAAQKNGSCLEYEVQHPRWNVWEATRASFSGDAARVFGAELAQALKKEPDSAFLTPGSLVTVFKGTRIR